MVDVRWVMADHWNRHTRTHTLSHSTPLGKGALSNGRYGNYGGGLSQVSRASERAGLSFRVDGRGVGAFWLDDGGGYGGMKVRWVGPPASFLNGRVGNSGPFLRGGSDLSLVSAFRECLRFVSCFGSGSGSGIWLTASSSP